MKLEDQVTSLELSKRLKELGVNQESLFYWTHLNGEDFLMIVKDFEGESIPKDRKDEFTSAFTVAELGEMLPDNEKYRDEYWQLTMSKWPSGYSVDYMNDFHRTLDCGQPKDEFLANALAKMLIYLLEQSLITSKK